MITELLALFKNGVFLAAITRDENGVPTEFVEGDLAAQLGALTEAALLRVKEIEAEKEALAKQNFAEIDALVVQNTSEKEALYKQNTINVDALKAQHQAEIEIVKTAQESLKAEYDALLARATKAAVDARAVIANKDISSERTCEIIDASAADLLKDKKERDIEAADKAAAEAAAYAARLRAA